MLKGFPYTFFFPSEFLHYSGAGISTYGGVEQSVARKAHNLEVVGSSPASATIGTNLITLSEQSCPVYVLRLGVNPTRHTHDDIEYGTRLVTELGDVGSIPTVVTMILA